MEFEKWLKKYFSEPRTTTVYKSKNNDDEYTIESLRKRHKKAFKQQV